MRLEVGGRATAWFASLPVRPTSLYCTWYGTAMTFVACQLDGETEPWLAQVVEGIRQTSDERSTPGIEGSAR